MGPLTHSQLRRAPKVVLHDHLDGGLRPQTILELASEIGHELPEQSVEDLSNWFHTGASRRYLPLYLETFEHTVAVMQNENSLIRVARECAEDLAADGVVYAEVRFAPELHLRGELSLDQVVEAVQEGFRQGQAASGETLTMGTLLTAMRHQARSSEIAELALRHRDLGVVGFDIAGAEAGFPPSRHLDAFETMHRGNGHVTIHAGEAFGLPSIWEAIQFCGAERLGHGVRISDDITAAGDGSYHLGRLASVVRDRRIPLELCPSSNVHTGAVASIADHPIGLLMKLRFRVTVNTDNRLMSNTTMTNEFAVLADAFGLGWDDVEWLTINAMKSSFWPFDERLTIINKQLKPGFAALRADTEAHAETEAAARALARATLGAAVLTPSSAPAELPKLRFQRPALPSLDQIAPYFAEAERIRWYSNNGPCHEQLTERIERYVGHGVHAVPVGNCTLGLMALLDTTRPAGASAPVANGPRPLVVTPSYTFVAAASAILWAGFEPLFVDVDPLTWQLTPEVVAEALDAHRGRVAAVLATSTFGCAVPDDVYRQWAAACSAHDVALIIDSAAGFGARDDLGRLIGGRGVAEVFSFHATKPFAIGEGGVITTTDAALAQRLRQLINFGFDDSRQVVLPGGFNAKLDELHAAVGLSVLDHYEAILEARRASAKVVTSALVSLGYTFQPLCENATWQHIATQAPAELDRDRFLALAAARGVEVRTYFDIPLHAHPAYAHLARHGSLAVTERLAARALSLPMANDLDGADLERIVALASSTAPT